MSTKSTLTKRGGPALADYEPIPGPTESKPSTLVAGPALHGKRIGMVVLSSYPNDPRPRRAVEALLTEGAHLDLICADDEGSPKRERLGDLDIFRIPIRHHRGGKLSYAYEYAAFVLISAGLLGWRSLWRRYDLIYIHNMPDILVLSALLPKVRGAKVILDQHDPMPELMMTIFELEKNSLAVRVIRTLEKWSIACANLVITVNVACKRIFAARSCHPEKIGIVMNSPDGDIFPYRSARSYAVSEASSGRPFVIMYHGSIVKRNGLDVAVDAVARVRANIPNAELRIYGSQSSYLEDILKSAYKRGLQKAIRYLGPKRLEDLASEIEQCDVGVIPNHCNAFTEINTPTRIFEYLALGKPVVAPRTSGIQDYFGPESLFFFEPGDSKDLAQQIAYVASHRDEAIETTERGQQVYLAHTWRREREALVNLVSGLLKEELRSA